MTCTTENIVSYFFCVALFFSLLFFFCCWWQLVRVPTYSLQMRCITVNKVAADCRLPAEPFVQGANAGDNHDNDNKQKEEERENNECCRPPCGCPIPSAVCAWSLYCSVLSCLVLFGLVLSCPVPTAASTSHVNNVHKNYECC